jgi:hypothetical protein
MATNSPKGKQAAILLIGSATIALTLLVFKIRGRVDDPESMISETMGHAEKIVLASEQYFAGCGRWPSNLETLVTYKRWASPGTNDAWGHRFRYVPYDPVRGFGVVITLGADSKPGGLGTNADGFAFFGGKSHRPSLAEIEDWTNDAK